MTPITPEALCGQSFSKTNSGYDPAEVDAYIRRLTENYSLLYRENSALLKQVREMREKLHTMEEEQSIAAQTLQNAQVQGDKIIEQAYIKADDILASVQMNCDSILRHFREKAEAQEKALWQMKQSIFKFKNNLFEQYRLHVELIEEIFPAGEKEEAWTPAAYSQHIVAELKRKIAEQYEIFPETQETLPIGEKKPAFETSLSADLVPSDPTPCKRANTKKKIVKKAPSVMDLIDAYEDQGLKTQEKPSSQQQFMLDFDHPSEEGVMIDKKQ